MSGFRPPDDERDRQAVSPLLPYGTINILQGLGVMLASIGICGAFGIAAAVLEKGKTNEEIARWGYWGTTIGVVFGVPLTICAFVLMARGR